MRRLFTSVACLVALAGCSKPESAPEPVRAVKAMTIAAQSARGTYEYAADIRARTESRLGFRVGGKLIRRNVNAGDAVKAGQVLAQLDPQDLRLGQESARAAVAAAQASFEQTRADTERYRELRRQGFIGAAEMDRREAALTSARAQLDQAQAQARVQGNQAGYAALLADAAGVITAADVEPGTVVAAGAPVVSLAHDGPRDVVFAVPEDKVGLIKTLATQPGRFKARLWGVGGEPLPVNVREVSPAADAQTRTFLVKADLGAGVSSVRLGQTATVIVELPATPGIAKLPLSALREEQGHSAVWVVDRSAMTVRAQPVDVAGASGNEAVVTRGLQPGDVVVTAGVHVLTPGQKVRLYTDPGVPPGTAASAAIGGTPVSVK